MRSPYTISTNARSTVVDKAFLTISDKEVEKPSRILEEAVEPNRTMLVSSQSEPDSVHVVSQRKTPRLSLVPCKLTTRSQLPADRK